MPYLPIPIDLSFLHPVQEIIITIRKISEMGSSSSAQMLIIADDQGARTKNYFAYHGGGSDPNIESMRNKANWLGKSNAGATSNEVTQVNGTVRTWLRLLGSAQRPQP